jgi:chorismate dehydratase
MGRSPSTQLRLGRINFLNVFPIYHPLEAGIVPHSFSIVSGAPSELNDLMSRGELDLSVVSSIEYARHYDRYYLLPDLSISCNGPVRSVLLLSRAPIDTLSGETVLVSTQSHTSVALLKVLFSKHLGIEARYLPGSASATLDKGEHPTALLTIGDEALRLRNDDRYPYQLDLGEAWHSWTGLPFVFATWVIQREAVERWNGRLEPAMEALFAAKRWGSSHLDHICKEAAGRGLLTFDQLCDYYQVLRFDLGAKEQKGLELFFKYLLQVGEIREMPPPEIYSPLAYVA